jgi:hypothetical protein
MWELHYSMSYLNNKLLRRGLWQIFHGTRTTASSITRLAQIPCNCAKVLANRVEKYQEKVTKLNMNHDNVCYFDKTNVFLSLHEVHI